MTAVAEGAAVFGESIDWSSESRGRKSSRGSLMVGGPLALTLSFAARTPDAKTRIGIQLKGEPAPGMEFQMDCLDTGWSSGRLPLRSGVTVDVTLSKPSENTFKLFVFDTDGGPVQIDPNRIVISRVAASIDGIPASHSMGIEVLEKLGGRPSLDWLVRAGEPLPKKGTKTFRASESLRAGSNADILFKLWEGDIQDPIHDNRYIGCLRISGKDIEDGAIAAGAELVCEYEISESGNARLEVSVPSIGAAFQSGRNFYSRTDGQMDFTAAARQVGEEADRTRSRIEEVERAVTDPKLEVARKKVESAAGVRPDEADPEVSKKALDEVLEARKLLAQVRKAHLREIREIDLESLQEFFGDHVKPHAKPAEVSAVETLFKTAQRSMERDDRDFENLLADVRGRNWDILWRQDWFIVDRFKMAQASPGSYSDGLRYQEAIKIGEQALKNGDVDRLRQVVAMLGSLRFAGTGEDEMLATAKILRG